MLTFKPLPDHLKDVFIQQHPSFSDPSLHHFPYHLLFQLLSLYQGCERGISSAGGQLCAPSPSLVRDHRLISHRGEKFGAHLEECQKGFIGGSAKPLCLCYYCCCWTVTLLPKQTTMSAAL